MLTMVPDGFSAGEIEKIFNCFLTIKREYFQGKQEFFRSFYNKSGIEIMHSGTMGQETYVYKLFR
jgi:hypothetical protein